ncbi:MAG: hypothetical protein HYV04_02235 [Deltaproteobacteria bacterium]|nr:hypothetical protein [Deltaproteobacteria bacterium]
MLRFLVFFIFAYLFFLLLNLYIAWRRRQRNLDSRQRGKEPEPMVLDPQCQSYVPKGSALYRGGHYFCSEECARLYLAS